MGKCNFRDTLLSVDIQEIVKINGKVIKIYEGIIYQKKLRYHHLEKS